MRVATYYNNHDVRVEERSIPEINTGELLVKVIASGICGSDVMEWYRVKKAPLVLGHEITGEVVKVGKGIEGIDVGARVFISHHVPCCKCRYCLDNNETVCDTLRSTNIDPGGFAQYIRVPRINVENGTYLLPDEISFEEGTFIEPVACVIRGQRKACMKAGKSVMVIGSGLSGILHIQMARLLGANVVLSTDINEFRLEAARKSGANLAVHADDNIVARLREINEGRLADLVIICAGVQQAIDQAFQSVEKGGTILLFASPSPDETYPVILYDMWKEGITLTTSYAGGPSDILEAINLIGSQKIRVRDMITHRLGLSETGLGFQLTAQAGQSLKVVIEPQR